MTYELDAAGVGRLETYFEGIGALLGEKRRRASFALYAMGILGEHERKSVEPLAAAAADDPEAAQRAHDHLLHFIGQSEWGDGPIRDFAARYAVHAMESRERVSAWVIDDTGFLKQGRESPGVQRQYTGSIGKIANCQIGVSLTLCTPTEHVPIDMELYLPESWTSDRIRCAKANHPVVHPVVPVHPLRRVPRQLPRLSCVEVGTALGYIDGIDAGLEDRISRIIGTLARLVGR